MRVAASGKELLGQRNGNKGLTSWFTRGVQGARPRRQNLGAAKGLLQANGCGSGKNELMSGFAFPSERHVGGVLCQGAAKVGFGSNIMRSRKAVESEVTPFRTLQRIVALVADEGKSRTTHARG